MGIGCPCPPVRNDNVTPRHLFSFLLASIKDQIRFLMNKSLSWACSFITHFTGLDVVRHVSVEHEPVAANHTKDDTIEHEIAKFEEAGDRTHEDEATIVDSAVPTVVAIKDINKAKLASKVRRVDHRTNALPTDQPTD